jgi:hypothetical protein
MKALAAAIVSGCAVVAMTLGSTAPPASALPPGTDFQALYVYDDDVKTFYNDIPCTGCTDPLRRGSWSTAMRYGFVHAEPIYRTERGKRLVRVDSRRKIKITEEGATKDAPVQVTCLAEMNPIEGCEGDTARTGWPIPNNPPYLSRLTTGRVTLAIRTARYVRLKRVIVWHPLPHARAADGHFYDQESRVHQRVTCASRHFCRVTLHNSIADDTFDPPAPGGAASNWQPITSVHRLVWREHVEVDAVAEPHR